MSNEEKVSQHLEQHKQSVADQVDVGGGSARFDQAGQQVGSQVNVGGDVYGGIRITEQRIDRDDARNQRNHGVLRQAVRRFWIDGVLKSSLYKEMLIRLGLESNPDAVDNRPWDLVLQQPDQPDRAIADGKEIIDIFDEMGQQMLILGEPGSGKTTTLLTLADGLLVRTEADLMLPTPVVFNLSSWAQKQSPLEQWLVEELNTRYQMPRKVSQGWVENDELLLLLDGLDEVAEGKRDACVAAINEFRREHVVGVVVCSRTTEYAALTAQLKLVGAVAVRPLSQAQIDEYVRQAHVAALGAALRENAELQALAQTPLMLSVMTLAYQQGDERSNGVDGAGRSVREQLFDQYIRRMFIHRGTESIYPQKTTLHRLCWVAQKLLRLGYSIFLIEDIQPKWLHSFRAKLVYIWVTRLVFSFAILTVFGAIDYEYLDRFLEHFFYLDGWLKFWLLAGFVSWIVIAVTDSVRLVLSRNPIPINRSVRRLILAVGYTMMFILMLFSFAQIVPPFILAPGIKMNDLSILSLSGLVAAFGTHSTFRVMSARPRIDDEIVTAEAVRLSLQGIVRGALWGIVAGQFIAVIPSNMMFISLHQWLLISLLGATVGMVTGSQELIRRDSKLEPNEGIRLTIQYAFASSLIVLISLLIVRGIDHSLSGYLDITIPFVIAGSIVAFLVRGGFTVLQHAVLRLMILLKHDLPWNYARFFNYCVTRIFMRRVGGGYIFVHRMIMEHFASLSEADIDRITAGLER